MAERLAGGVAGTSATAAAAARAAGRAALDGAGAGQVGDARRLTGVGVSAGTVTGPVVRMTAPAPLPPPHLVADPAAELASARQAVRAVAADLTVRAGRVAGEAKEILEALAMMAVDPTLGADLEQRIASGTDAAHALTGAFDAQAELLREAGGYLAERAADLEDLRDRAVATVLGRPIPGIPDPGHPFVLVAADLAPADTANLNPEQVLAIVTERGGPTSHTAILARGLGIPAIVAAAGVTEIADGTVVAVDGTSGTVTVGVEPLADTAPRVRTRTQTNLADLGPCHTKDGHPVSLYLNIGSLKDVRPGAQGVGLLRTEFLFLGRKDAPSIAEQHAAYLELFNAFPGPGTRVVIRTLDAGADKPLPFLGLPDEENPALGVRGLRTARLRPEVLDDQLAAIAAAAAEATCEVWVMAPMVATPAEAAEFAAKARAHGLEHVGAMIEIPAAALRASRLLQHLDFLSIGTNDLGQYTMATDRQDGRLPDLLDPWQPALLELIALAAEAGRAAGKPVGVCGEAAADPGLAAVLVGLGVTSLSMTAAAVPAVHASLSARTLPECRDLALRARDVDDPAEAKEYAALAPPS
ncbi:phosphotransferase system enzyme I (PtsI) [Catenulispora sp. EB89]|uniref:phosphoenolpyruvate--protein phosphotransferase n=1 Tax=Catenulispora sp. EB89 TaxID=3156257 RepID=UPI00351691AF